MKLQFVKFLLYVEEDKLKKNENQIGEMANIYEKLE